jgi:hypothetical protein
MCKTRVPAYLGKWSAFDAAQENGAQAGSRYYMLLKQQIQRAVAQRTIMLPVDRSAGTEPSEEVYRFW